MKDLEIAIVGASGLVGEKILQILKEEKLIQKCNLTLYVSNNSAGKVLVFNGEEYNLILLSGDALKKHYDIVFFSAGDEISKLWVEKFADKGAFVIDNSNAFRRDKNIPLVVPEINIERVNENTKIIANPNCSTIQLVMVIDILRKLSKIDKIVVSSYQSVSGAGKKALDDLFNKTNYEIKEGINGNVICKIGKIEENGFCTEENKIMFELNKILDENISLCASTVRVPVPFCHTESVYVKFNKNVKMSDILSNFYNSTIFLDNEISLPSNFSDTNVVSVFRLRQFSENEISFFVLADNLRRGAGYNAVLIAKYIIERFLK